MEAPPPDNDRTTLPARQRAISPGDRIRDWEIESFLGSGSFGTVWMARRVRLGGFQTAALKILDRVMVSETRAQLVAEFSLLSSIEHPNLLRYLDAFEIEEGRLSGFIVFVLELANTDLRNAIAETSTGLNEAEMCEAFADLASGLAVFHDLGHCHGDIKPANILQVGKIWKLADFGIAAPLDGSYAIVGGTTFDYCPPEELSGNLEIDEVNQGDRHLMETGGRRLHRSADIWALGISLHYAITKQHPFPGESVRSRIASVLSGNCRLSGTVSDELRRVLEVGCFNANHKERWTAHELSAHFRSLGQRTDPAIGGSKNATAGRIQAASVGSATMQAQSATVPMVGTVRDGYRPPIIDPGTQGRTQGVSPESGLPGSASHEINTDSSSSPKVSPSRVKPPKRTVALLVVALSLALGVAGVVAVQRFRSKDPSPALTTTTLISTGLSDDSSIPVIGSTIVEAPTSVAAVPGTVAQSETVGPTATVGQSEPVGPTETVGHSETVRSSSSVAAPPTGGVPLGLPPLP